MRRRRFCALLGGAAVAPLTGIGVRAGTPEACGVPVARDDGSSGASGTDDGLIDRALLCRMLDERATSPDFRVHAVLVARTGRVVFERYIDGADEVPGRFFGSRVETVAFGAETLHAMKSVSKSVASLVVGIAIDRGLIHDIHAPILDFFPDLSDLRSVERDRIRFVDALTMSMGLAWDEADPTRNFANDEVRMNLAWDPTRYVLSRPVIAPAGETFFYNTGALRLVSAIIHKVTGVPLDDFARSCLFEPLGIEGTWARVRGETDAGGGLRLRPRDMMKLGRLVLDGGRWNDRQIVSKAWIDASTTPTIAATDGQSYGYLWWFGRTRIDGHDLGWIGALGRGGQSIRIVPDRDLVIAVTAGYYQDYSAGAFRTQFGVFRDVLRATSHPI